MPTLQATLSRACNGTCRTALPFDRNVLVDPDPPVAGVLPIESHFVENRRPHATFRAGAARIFAIGPGRVPIVVGVARAGREGCVWRNWAICPADARGWVAWANVAHALSGKSPIVIAVKPHTLRSRQNCWHADGERPGLSRGNFLIPNRR